MRLLEYGALALILSLTGMEPLQQSSGCRTTIEFVSYDVRGRSADELRTSMLERGPIDERGVRRFAATEWDVHWDWRRNSDGSVAPKSVAVRCSAKVTLPRLAADVEPTAELLAAWKAYQERLRAHELNHLKHLRTVAPSIAERIVLWGHRHGAITVQKANDIARGVLLEVKELDRNYDAQTAHGRSEGLWSVTD